MEKQVQGVALVVEGTVLHTLYNKGKHLKTIGPLEVVNKEEANWIRVNNWYEEQITKQTEFYRVESEKYSSYVFQNIAGGFYAISIGKENPNLPIFEQKIKTLASVFEYGDDNNSQDFKRKIAYHYPDIGKAPIHQQNVFTPLFALTGKVQGTIGANIELNQESLKTKTKNVFKSGWQSLKSGFKKVNEKVDQIPGVVVTKNFIAQSATKIKDTTGHLIQNLIPKKQQVAVAENPVPEVPVANFAPVSPNEKVPEVVAFSDQPNTPIEKSQ